MVINPIGGSIENPQIILITNLLVVIRMDNIEEKMILRISLIEIMVAATMVIMVEAVLHKYYNDEII